MTSPEPQGTQSTHDLIELVVQTRRKVEEAAQDLGVLTRELRRRLDEESDDKP